MKRKNLTKKRLKDLWVKTSECYSEAVKEYGTSTFELRELYLDHLISEEDYSCKLEELDEIYRLKLCSLPSEVIEDVVRANDKGLQIRARKTVASLTTELLERQLRNEEERSS